jgi:uncharacterized protein (DUF58 family)
VSVRACFDDAFLIRLEKLRLLARRKLARGALGQHRSWRHGSGFEPAGHRAYAPGDDFRRIDWNAFRRLERLYVTEREEESERAVLLVLDRSASMEGPKLELARRLVAALAHVALAEGDAVRVVAFAADTVAALPPRRGHGAIFPIFDFLDGLSASGGTTIAAACQKAVRGPRRPGLAVLVTDFLSEEKARSVLAALSQSGRDVVLAHVVAPEDARPALEGTRRLVDSETREELVLTFDRRARDEYMRAFDEWVHEIMNAVRSFGGTYARIGSELELETAALAVLERAGVLT